MRFSRTFLISAAVLFALTVGSIAAGYRLNLSASLPAGIYRVSPLRATLAYGDLVTFWLPYHLRLHGFLGSFTKPVAGLPGDVVCVREGQLIVNGVDYGPVLPEAPARVLIDGACEMVPDGAVFTASPVPRSYDSRYFGMIALADVQPATPVWTWGGSH
jgi:conjugative transfer signal peptidase TraF